MSSGYRWAVLDQIRGLFSAGTVSGLTEWELIDRYVDRHDETAFEALVARHGPMVLGVCRRVSDDPHDVEDAFQATFLVLVKKARSLSTHDAVAHWLYGVAYRVSLHARNDVLKRRKRERSEDLERPCLDRDPANRELGTVLDQELMRLPQKYRGPIALCYLEGLSHEEAAAQLGWPVGTIKGRLSRGRELLKGRLARRGVAPTACVISASFSREALACVPPALLESTIQSASRFAAGRIAVTLIPCSVAALVEGVLATMSLTKLKSVIVSLILLAVAAAGAGVVAQQAGEGNVGGSAPAAVSAGGAPPTAVVPNARTQPGSADVAGDPKSAQPLSKPFSVIERERRDLASQVFDRELDRYRAGESHDLTAIAEWSKRIADSSTNSGMFRNNSLERHLARMEDLVRAVSAREKVNAGRGELLIAEYYEREAASLLIRARTGRDSSVLGSGPGGRPVTDDSKSLAIHDALDRPIDMEFPAETPLEDVLKHIKKESTLPALPNGIPIYVDPVGLQEAEKTLQSPVTLDLRGIALRTTLSLILKQLGLTYTVKSGLLTITAESSLDQESSLELMVEKAGRGQLSREECQGLLESLKSLSEIEKLQAAIAKSQRERKVPTKGGMGGGFQ